MNESKRSFRVQDKRRIDEEGEEKDETKSGAESQADDENGNFVMADEEQADDETAAILDFSAFIMSLATQALIQLGQAAPPEGFSIPKDPAAARQTIDILSMLQEKTKGNLDAQEERLLEEILHTLRMSYLKVS
jgi:hypothetical protein